MLSRLELGGKLLTQSGATKNRAVVTACDSKYFKSCLTLLTSLYKYSNNLIDIMYIFDFGLKENESLFLSYLKKVQLVSKNQTFDYFNDTIDTFPDFLTPNQFAYKPHFIRYTLDNARVVM